MEWLLKSLSWIPAELPTKITRKTSEEFISVGSPESLPQISLSVFFSENHPRNTSKNFSKNRSQTLSGVPLAIHGEELYFPEFNSRAKKFTINFYSFFDFFEVLRIISRLPAEITSVVSLTISDPLEIPSFRSSIENFSEYCCRSFPGIPAGNFFWEFFLKFLREFLQRFLRIFLLRISLRGPPIFLFRSFFQSSTGIFPGVLLKIPDTTNPSHVPPNISFMCSGVLLRTLQDFLQEIHLTVSPDIPWKAFQEIISVMASEISTGPSLVILFKVPPRTASTKIP